MVISNFSESLAKPLVMAKLNMAYLPKFKKTEQNCLIAGVKLKNLSKTALLPVSKNRAALW